MSATNKSMPYVRLGSSGLKVSKIILGCMSYGTLEWAGWVLPEEEGIKHIKAAYDTGINTFDTADSYSMGESEVILGKAIKQHNLPREEIVVMTKLFFLVGKDITRFTLSPAERKADSADHVNQYGLSRKHIFDGVKQSLKRLQLDYIDVLQCHRFDDDTPIAETMEALHDCVKAGYVRYIGMSSCYAWQFHVMQNYAITHGLTPFISMQNHYNLLYREEEREMFPTLKHFGVGSIPWSPLARGLLTRPFIAAKDGAGTGDTKRGETDTLLARYTTAPGTPSIIPRVSEIAEKRNISMAQVAIAWVLSKEGVSAATVGTTSLKNMKDIIAAVNVKLTEEEIKYLDEPYQAQGIVGFA
ncbi:NADP-dependent oxidoreductase domain-containing protein [Mycena floridula]|nr:NADP-dependent oxidoreductase domain-containing protein [Mycena floridula]